MHEAAIRELEQAIVIKEKQRSERRLMGGTPEEVQENFRTADRLTEEIAELRKATQILSESP